MVEITAESAFREIKKIALSSERTTDALSMKARAREVVDRFLAAMTAKRRDMAGSQTETLFNLLDGACVSRHAGSVATTVFMEVRDRRKPPLRNRRDVTIGERPIHGAAPTMRKRKPHQCA